MERSRTSLTSRDIVFDEKFYNPEANAEFVNIQVEEPRIVLDSITVLPEPPTGQLPSPPATDHPESDDEEFNTSNNEPGSDQEETTIVPPPVIAPKPVISTTSGQGQRASSRMNKGIITSTRFEDENFEKLKRKPTALIAKVLDPNDEQEPQTYQEAMNHPQCTNQWEQAIIDEYNSLIKNGTWVLVKSPRIEKSLAANGCFATRRTKLAELFV